MRWTPVWFINAALIAVILHSRLVSGANILGLFLSHSPSHLIVHMSVAKALAERGHNVTVVSTQKPKVTHEKIRSIVIPFTAEQEKMMNSRMSQTASQKNNIFTTLMQLFYSSRVVIDLQFDALKDKRFTALYDTPDTKFDLIIMGYFVNDFKLAAVARFKCPVIVNWMGPPMDIIDEYVGNPSEAAYVPTFNIPFKTGEVMAFPTRIQNFFSNIMFKILRRIIDFIMEKYYRGLIPNDGTYPSYYEMKKNVSMIFCNSHSLSEGPIRPFVPGLVEIGGIQVKDKPDPLPKDIKDFMDAANRTGAILFSLGSNVKSSNLKPEIIQTIFKTLSDLELNVIWKWEDLENTPGRAKNILYKSWLPQDDVLAHPNLKLFITHAGKGGVAEAQYHGVPMVALPIFGDQLPNADAITSSGYGLQLDMLTLNGDEFRKSIFEVINNPIYKENVQRFSQLYRDRPLTAKEAVIFWTEYVIRHRGAKHIQSPVVHMNAFQKSSLDVILFLCVMLYIVWKLFRLATKAIRKVLQALFASQKTKTKKE